MPIDVYYSTNTNRYLYKRYMNTFLEYEYLSKLQIGGLVVIKGVKNKLVSIVINLDSSFIEMNFIKA